MILILLLLTGCRFYETLKRAAAVALIHGFVSMQSRAPLTQSAVRPAAVPAPDCAGRLITLM